MLVLLLLVLGGVVVRLGRAVRLVFRAGTAGDFFPGGFCVSIRWLAAAVSALAAIPCFAFSSMVEGAAGAVGGPTTLCWFIPGVPYGLKSILYRYTRLTGPLL